MLTNVFVGCRMILDGSLDKSMNDRIKKLSPKHLQMVEFVVTHPGASTEEVAAFFRMDYDYTRALVAGLMFKEAVKLRAEEIRLDLQDRYVKTLAKAYDLTDAALIADKATIENSTVEAILKDKAIDRAYSLGHAKAAEKSMAFSAHATVPVEMLGKLAAVADQLSKPMNRKRRLERPSGEEVLEAEVGGLG